MVQTGLDVSPRVVGMAITLVTVRIAGWREGGGVLVAEQFGVPEDLVWRYRVCRRS
jgi:hypothetical protein